MRQIKGVVRNVLLGSFTSVKQNTDFSQVPIIIIYNYHAVSERKDHRQREGLNAEPTRSQAQEEENYILFSLQSDRYVFAKVQSRLL
jgi:hypothetical protein